MTDRWRNSLPHFSFRWGSPALFDDATTCGAAGEVLRDPQTDTAYVTSYQGARAVFASASLGNDTVARESKLRRRWGQGAVFELLSRRLEHHNPPTHTDLRRRRTPFFSLGSVSALRAFVRDELERLKVPATNDQLDLVRTILEPLARRSMMHFFGIAQSQEQLVERGVNAWGELLEPDAALSANSRAALLELLALVRATRSSAADDSHPAKSLWMSLHGLSDAGAWFDTVLITSLSSGTQNVRDLCAGMILELAGRPDIQCSLLAGGISAEAVVREALRVRGPVMFSGRTVLRPTRICGVDFAAGDHVSVAVSAANRDKSIWPDPERFEPFRALVPSLALGHGIHYCLGASLVRVLCEVIAESVPELLKDRRILSFERRASNRFSGFTKLVVGDGE